MNVALIAGAKVKTFFDSCKFIFGNFYPLPKSAYCQYLPMNFAFIAGAKVAPFSAFANFILTFFKLFRNTLVNRTLQNRFFDPFASTKHKPSKNKGSEL
ncbi:hypothetical protein ABH942_000001 [Flavobacterium sp. 28YEA47A]|uniref:hypothetical protein n=1 Tax=Flavobacterium sp. 28YEA47A TaxID=3156276 RepID=UPI003517519F